MRHCIGVFLLSLVVVGSLSGGTTDSPDEAVLNFRLTDTAPSAGVRGGRTFGRAVAWGDYDQDGWLDLVVCNSMGRTLLYRNNGDLTFTDVSADIGFPSLAEPVFGGLWGDYDNDGDQDLYFAIGAEIQDEDNLAAENRLLRNDVNTTGRFTDVTAVANASGGRRRSWGAAWADYNNDGFLDVYVSNTNEPNVLLRNRGDGTFEDVSVAAGVDDDGNGRFPLWLDYNLDGWMDIFVVNAKGPDRLYRNNADGTFTDVAAQAGVAEGSRLTWVASSEDFNHDGWPDVFVASWNNQESSEPAALYINRGDATFVQQAAAAGVGFVARSMSVQTGDVNNDGRIDILVGNGGPSGPDPNSLYLNAFDLTTRTLKFLDASEPSGLTAVNPGCSHGIGLGDFDNDGDLDVYISDGGPASRQTSAEVNHFFLNEGGNLNHSIRLRLEGTRSNRDAVGARVKVVTSELTQHLYVKGGSGFSSTNEPFLWIGLGAASQADLIEIRWPSGSVQTLRDIPTQAKLTIREPGAAVNWRPPSRATAWELERAAETERARRSASFTVRCACCSYGALVNGSKGADQR